MVTVAGGSIVIIFGGGLTMTFVGTVPGAILVVAMKSHRLFDAADARLVIVRDLVGGAAQIACPDIRVLEPVRI